MGAPPVLRIAIVGVTGRRVDDLGPREKVNKATTTDVLSVPFGG